MKTKKILLVTAIFSLLSASSAGIWTQTESTDGINIYTRSVEGRSIDEFMGTVIINAPIEKVSAVLLDIPKFTEWFGYCKEIKVVKSYSDYKKLVYLVIKSPWPLTDRDLYVDVIYNISPTSVNVSINMADSKHTTSYYRMTKLVSRCVCTLVGENKVKVEYYVDGDPGGNIPSSLSNWFVKDQPLKTLKGLRIKSEPHR
jgi:hypothetical protein